MNILIVGNGFDLSHYLPTKYDHFMDAMQAIEKKDTGGLPNNLENTKLEDWLEQIENTFEHRKDIALPVYEMNFDELFAKTRDPKFITKTRDFYLTENIQICAKDVLKLQYRLEMNCWYKYFKNHVEKIKTWIDFEQKIEEVLVVLAKTIIQIEKKEVDDSFDLSDILSQKYIKTLNFFRFSNDLGGSIKFGGKFRANPIQICINPQFCHGKNSDNGLSANIFIDFLHQELESFIEIFNLYLDLIINNLNPKKQLKIFVKSRSLLQLNVNNWVTPDKIFSFNYTNTYQRIYDSIDVEYLHGSHGEFQNIVLGVSDLTDKNLEKLKAFGFTKYHQKLFKDTDYLFLDNYRTSIDSIEKEIKSLEQQVLTPMGERYIRVLHEQLKDKESSQSLNLNFMIWGHSLDVSDQDYIKDLFSLNDEIDRNVRVTVYYFDRNAKFLLLNNLLSILGKDKVEQWMKKGWLIFEENPKIDFGIQEESEPEQQAS